MIRPAQQQSDVAALQTLSDRLQDATLRDAPDKELVRILALNTTEMTRQMIAMNKRLDEMSAVTNEATHWAWAGKRVLGTLAFLAAMAGAIAVYEKAHLILGSDRGKP